MHFLEHQIIYAYQFSNITKFINECYNYGKKYHSKLLYIIW